METYFGAGDIQAMLADFGKTVTFGLLSTTGVLNVADEEVLQTFAGAIVGKDRVITIETGSLEGLVEGSRITVYEGASATNYEVRDSRQVGDGAITRILCKDWLS